MNHKKAKKSKARNSERKDSRKRINPEKFVTLRLFTELVAEFKCQQAEISSLKKQVKELEKKLEKQCLYSEEDSSADDDSDPENDLTLKDLQGIFPSGSDRANWDEYEELRRAFPPNDEKTPKSRVQHPSKPGTGRRENYRSNVRQSRRYLDWLLSGSPKMKNKVFHPRHPTADNADILEEEVSEIEWMKEFSKRYIAYRSSLRRLVVSRPKPIPLAEDSMNQSFKRIIMDIENFFQKIKVDFPNDSWKDVIESHKWELVLEDQH